MHYKTADHQVSVGLVSACSRFGDVIEVFRVRVTFGFRFGLGLGLGIVCGGSIVAVRNSVIV